MADELKKSEIQNPSPSKKKRSPFAETTPVPFEIERRSLTNQSRRDFLIYTAGIAAAAAGFYWLLPTDTQTRLGAKNPVDSARKTRFLNGVLTFDDDVAEALYSPSRLVPTYSHSQVTELRNNYDGETPDPSYIDRWTLTLEGLESGEKQVLNAHQLLTRFVHHEQITRLVCVEGWSAIAWWGGLRFADLIRQFPPRPDAKWALLRSSVNLDSDGNPDPYYVSIDLPTAIHPQTLLATHKDGKKLTVDYGAPLRLVAPMKLGLKNIKAITKIEYTANEPPDYWNERGYSKYDGL